MSGAGGEAAAFGQMSLLFFVRDGGSRIPGEGGNGGAFFVNRRSQFLT